MRKIFAFISLFALAVPFTVTVAQAQPTLWIDNDTSYSLPYKTWSDQYSKGTGVWYNDFVIDPNLQSVNDFHGDSESAQASPSVPGGTPGYYHWDLPTNTNTLTTYSLYVYLDNPYFTNHNAQYDIDNGYSNATSFTVHQDTAATGWYSYAVVHTYGTAHIRVNDLNSDGAAGVTYTGADGVGLQ